MTSRPESSGNPSSKISNNPTGELVAAAAAFTGEETQHQNVMHAICFEEPGEIIGSDFLGNTSQVRENFQLLTLVSADDQGTSRSLCRNQQQLRGKSLERGILVDINKHLD